MENDGRKGTRPMELTYNSTPKAVPAQDGMHGFLEMVKSGT
jgi:hypothetical protein